jgi:SEC-C motif-containing protein
MSRRRSRPAASAARPVPAAPAACPCGLPAPYAECCGRLHAGAARAATAEQLMRSRYSAFAVRDADYLLRTWHPSTRPPALELDRTVRWTGLEILATEDGTAFHRAGVVEFRAHCSVDGRPDALHERSRFSRDEDGAWTYLDGVPDPAG